MARKIKFASFQSALSAPGVFGGDTSLSTDVQKNKRIKMTLEPGVLHCTDGTEEVLVPLTNIKCMMVDVSGEENDKKK